MPLNYSHEILMIQFRKMAMVFGKLTIDRIHLKEYISIDNLVDHSGLWGLCGTTMYNMLLTVTVK